MEYDWWLIGGLVILGTVLAAFIYFILFVMALAKVGEAKRAFHKGKRNVE